MPPRGREHRDTTTGKPRTRVSSVELGLAQDTKRSEDLGDSIVAASEAGFDVLGAVAGRIPEGSKQRFERADLRCHELLGLIVGEDPAVAVDTAATLAADAARLDATWVVTTFDVPLTREVSATVRECAATLADADVGLAVEFSPLGPVATIADGLEVLEAAAPSHAGLVVDSWNFCVGPSTWTDLEQIPLEAVAYVQFADALTIVGTPDLDDAMRRRMLPGEGSLDLGRFVGTLRDRGWDGIVSMQVLSDELRATALDDYARRVYAAAVEFWR